MIRLTLPWPPSTNRYWRHWQGRTLLSREGRTYREAAVILSRGAGSVGDAPCRVAILAHKPDARRRDLDNLLKASLDALAAAGVYTDDAQITSLLIESAGIDRERPRLEITITGA